MSDLQIPAEAEAVAHAFGVSPQILADTAPLIVAAELRRLAAHAIARTAGLPVDVAAFGELRMHAAWLRVRADELDGGAK